MSKIVMLIYHHWENFLLDLRFHDLYDIVDKFIIVEYPFGFRRQSTPMYFGDNKSQFEEFKDKYIHVVDNYTYPNQQGLQLLWSRKAAPILMQTLNSICDDDSFVIACDSDAVITSRAFKGVDLSRQTQFILGWGIYWMNVFCHHAAHAWTVSAPWWIIKKIGLMRMVGYVEPGQQVQILTEPGMGYHFCKLGGVDKVWESNYGYPHQELITPGLLDKKLIQERIDNLWGWTDESHGTNPQDWTWTYQDYDPNDYPQYLNDHPEIFKQYFLFKDKSEYNDLTKWSSIKDKTYEEIYGEEKAQEIKEKQSIAHNNPELQKRSLKKRKETLENNPEIVKEKGKKISKVKKGKTSHAKGRSYEEIYKDENKANQQRKKRKKSLYLYHLNKLPLSIEEIIDLYINQKKSLIFLSKRLKCTTSFIKKILLKNNIILRTHSESMKGCIPWNKGLTLENTLSLKKNEKARRKISQKLLGNKNGAKNK